jgi:hypothetical protein
MADDPDGEVRRILTHYGKPSSGSGSDHLTSTSSLAGRGCPSWRSLPNTHRSSASRRVRSSSSRTGFRHRAPPLSVPLLLARAALGGQNLGVTPRAAKN